MRRNAERGFTLMELMVVIVIVAILAAVAVPLYINYVKDATRTEAKGAIGAIVTAGQTYYQINADGGPQEYANVTNADFLAKIKLNCDLTEALHNWTFVVRSADTDGFVAEASGVAGKSTASLGVRYTYSRANGGTWDEFTPAGP